MISRLAVPVRQSTMGDLERLLERLREETAVRGADWLQATVSNLLQAPSQAPSSVPAGPPPSERPHARWSRSPEHFSPPLDSAREQIGGAVQDLVLPARKKTAVDGGAAGSNSHGGLGGEPVGWLCSCPSCGGC